MQRQMYSSPLSIEQAIPPSVYTELRNVHQAFHPAPCVDQSVYTYFPAYENHHRPENYVDMTTHLQADINQETKRNVYKSIHYSSSDATNDKEANNGTLLSHRYIQPRTHSTHLPDFESFFGPQQYHHSEMLVVEKDLTGYASDGVYTQGVVEVNPRLAYSGKHSALEENNYKRNVTQQCTPFNGNVMLQTSARNFYQSTDPSLPTYTDIRLQSIQKIVHTDTEKQKYGNMLVKPAAEITRYEL
ncbi:uncharacterized protein LOC117119969 [Anneissia japonica]|uniref:uncharacterized protein LOC117119969 n=1 Tax=Anneissia japonica TaxID=1529436 RepID=UPI001425B6DA|nr:uncharacterized protein LOC117119969 [Anneissia japonica]